MDFQVITADTAISEEIETFRGQAYSNRFHREALTSRPVTLEQLRELIKTGRVLKKNRFPKSQLYALREAVVLGPQPRATNFYYYQKGRDDAKGESKYKPLHRFLLQNADEDVLPFKKHKKPPSLGSSETNPASPATESGGDKLITPLVDLIEICDFIHEDGITE